MTNGFPRSIQDYLNTLDVSSKAIAINDPQIQSSTLKIPLADALYAPMPPFLETFEMWSNVDHSRFEPYITDGVTSAYEDFERDYPSLQTVTFVGEYPYHRSLGAKRVDSPYDIKKHHKLVISDPFAGHGCTHELLEETLEHCTALKVPVFIDRAFGMISNTLIKHYNYECIKYIAYSFSKMFNTGKCKLGVCYKDPNVASPMVVLNEYEYVNKVSVALHMELMHTYSVDYVFNKYRPTQIAMCKKLNLEVSDTVFIGYSYDSVWNTFNREGYVNRICLSKELTSIA